MADLLRLGVKTIPIVSKGDKYVSGQVLRDIAGLVGIDLSANAELSPTQLVEKLNLILDGAQRFLRQMPDEALDRSDEHTSELQSLMRTSYAVFCLKKKTR